MSSRSVAAAAGVTSVLFRAESCSTVQRDLTHCVPRLSWTLGSLPPPGRGASRGCAQGCGGICLTQPFKDGHILRSRGRNSHIWILTGPQVGVAAAETGDHTLGLETGRGRARWRAEDKTEVGGGGGGMGDPTAGDTGSPMCSLGSCGPGHCPGLQGGGLYRLQGGARPGLSGGRLHCPLGSCVARGLLLLHGPRDRLRDPGPSARGLP